ncbi:hypothetical protein [Nitrosospira multiformis]|jgi:hypothetical protein|nr:hypothetical protein [Nitrosospira multiformis]
MMTELAEAELAGLDAVIEARRMTSDTSDKYEQIVIPIGNAGTAVAGDNAGLSGGEGLSLDALMKLRENALS